MPTIFRTPHIVGTQRAFLEKIVSLDLGQRTRRAREIGQVLFLFLFIGHSSFPESRASVVLPGCARPPRWGPGFFMD